MSSVVPTTSTPVTQFRMSAIRFSISPAKALTQPRNATKKAPKKAPNRPVCCNASVPRNHSVPEEYPLMRDTFHMAVLCTKKERPHTLLRCACGNFTRKFIDTPFSGRGPFFFSFSVFFYSSRIKKNSIVPYLAEGFSSAGLSCWAGSP